LIGRKTTRREFFVQNQYELTFTRDDFYHRVTTVKNVNEVKRSYENK